MKMLAEWFWTDRWMGSSAFLLPMEARGVYREMLSQAWRRGARLPSDQAQVRRAIGASDEEWARSWPMVERYWRVDGDSLVNDTQLEVYAEAEGKRERAQARAQAGAQASAQARAQAERKHKHEQSPPSPSPTNLPPPPAREEPEAIDAESAALSQALVDALKRATEITGLSGMEILADAKVRGTGGPITNPLGCSPASRKLWRITVERVGGFVAAWKSDRKGKSAKRVAVPAFDRGADHAVTDADLAWDPRLGPAPKTPPEPRNEPEPERPALTLTVAPGACPVCGGPVRHSTEGGDTILRCDSEACGWAAVWRSVAA